MNLDAIMSSSNINELIEKSEGTQAKTEPAKDPHNLTK